MATTETIKRRIRDGRIPYTKTALPERKPRIYVCSPLRPNSTAPEAAKAELEANIERAKTACRLVANLGAVPICSHLFCTQFLDDSIPAEREQGRGIGLELLKDADELWCFSELISEGMMAEIQEASRLGIPVRMICETTGIMGKLLEQVGSDTADADADEEDTDGKTQRRDGRWKES